MASPAAILNVLMQVNSASATAELRKFNSALTRTDKRTVSATARTSALGKATGMAGGKLASAARYAAGAAAAYLSIAQAKAAVTTTQDLAKTTAGLNRNLGFTVKQGSRWAAVAKSRDVDAKALTMSFTTLSRRVVDASAALKEGGSAADSAMAPFKRLGISQREVAAGAKDLDAFIPRLADAFGEAAGGAERQASAQQLLGRGYATILPLFADGAKGLKEQQMWADKYGTTLNEKTLKAQMDLVSAQRESKVAWLGIQMTFAKAVTPALQKANEQFQKIAAIMADDKLTSEEKWKRVGDIIAKWGDKALDAFVGILPKMVEKAGEAAPRIAGAFVQGFMNADVWGKLLIGGWLITKLGGAAALRGVGSKAGKLIGRGLGLGILAGVLLLDKDIQNELKALFNKLIGESLDVPATEKFGQTLLEAFDVSGAELEIGKNAVAIRTELGRLVFNPDTGKLIRTQSEKLKGLIGKSMDQVAFAFSEPRKLFKMGFGLEKVEAELLEFGYTADQARDLATNAWLEMYTKIDDKNRKITDSTRRTADSVGRNAGRIDTDVSKLHQPFSDMEQDARKAFAGASDAAAKSAKSVKSSNDKTGHSMDEVGDKSRTLNKRGGGNYASFSAVVGEALRSIGTNTNEALKAMGVKQLKFGWQTLDGREKQQFYQRGGMAMVPGVGSGDKVPAMLEPGEVVINRRAVAAMGGAQRANRINDLIPRFAKGGVAGGLDFALGPHTVPPITYDAGHAGGNSHWHISGTTEPWIIATGKAMQRMGFDVGENPHFGGIQSSNHAHYLNDHWSGRAIDVNNFPTETLADSKRVAAYLRGKGAVVGAAAEKLKRTILEGPEGPLRDIGQAVLDKTTKAANAYLAKKSPAELSGMGGGAPGPNIKSLPGALQKYNRQYPTAMYPSAAWSALPQLPFDVVAALAEWAGNGRVPGVTMAKVSQGEGVLRPGSESSDGGHGLWGYTPRAAGLSWLSGIKGASGPESVHNPIIDAQVMAKMYPSGWAGGTPWYGSGNVNGDFNHHYSGPLLRRAGGIIQKLARGTRNRKGIETATGPGVHGQEYTVSTVRGEPGGITAPSGYAPEQYDADVGLPAGVRKGLRKLRENHALITERIANAVIYDAFPGSPAGEELSEGERLGQWGLNWNLLANLKEQVKLIKRGLATRNLKSSTRGRLITDLEGLQGKTGKGGEILNTFVELNRLQALGGVAGSEDLTAGRMAAIEELNRQLTNRNAVLTAQYPVLYGSAIPGMASGGVVPGAPVVGNADVQVYMLPDGNAHVRVNGQGFDSKVQTATRGYGRRPLPGARGS